MIVLDASAVVAALIGSETGEVVLDRLAGSSGGGHAPHLIDIEVVHALRRMARRHGDSIRWSEALRTLSDLPLLRWEHLALMPAIWSWRHSVTAYDAAYLALAQSLGAPLITLDKGLAAAGGGAVAIECLAS